MKAYKGDEGEIRLFRPFENMSRLLKSSLRLSLPVSLLYFHLISITLLLLPTFKKLFLFLPLFYQYNQYQAMRARVRVRARFYVHLRIRARFCVHVCAYIYVLMRVSRVFSVHAIVSTLFVISSRWIFFTEPSLQMCFKGRWLQNRL